MAEEATTTTNAPAAPVPAAQPTPASAANAQPVAAAVAAAPSPTPAADAKPKGESAAQEVDPWSARLLQDLGVVVEGNDVKPAPAPEPKAKEGRDSFMTLGEMAKHVAEKKAEAEPKPEEKTGGEKKEEKKAEPEKPAVQPAPKKKVEVVKEPGLEHLVEGLVKKFAATPVAVPPQPAKPAVSAEPANSLQPTDDAQYLESLTNDVQREEFEMAQYAAKAMPDKYKDMPARTKAYFGKIDAYIANKVKEDPSWDPKTDEEYGQFIEDNRPTYAGRDRKALERQQIVEETRKSVRAEFEPAMEETRQAVRASQIEPAINDTVKNYESYVLERVASEEKSPLAAVAKLAQEKGWAEAEAEDKLAAQAIRSFTQQAQSLAREYMRVDLKAKKYTDQEHQGLFNWIDAQAAAFKKNGGDLTKRQGKTFVTPKEMGGLPAAQQRDHWTFSTYEVLDILANMAVNSAKSAYNDQVQALIAAGYEKKPKAAITAKEEKPDKPKEQSRPATSPKATTTASPGAATTAPATNGGGAFSQAELDRYLRTGAARMK